MTPPSGEGEMKLSCFSAVMPVRGWNQWVKCVAPLDIAQSFIAPATALATPISRAAPSSIVFLSDEYTLAGRTDFITLSSNTMLPKQSDTFVITGPHFQKRESAFHVIPHERRPCLQRVLLYTRTVYLSSRFSGIFPSLRHKISLYQLFFVDRRLLRWYNNAQMSKGVHLNAGVCPRRDARLFCFE